MSVGDVAVKVAKLAFEENDCSAYTSTCRSSQVALIGSFVCLLKESAKSHRLKTTENCECNNINRFK